MLEDYNIKTLTASAGASRRIIQRSLNDQLRRSQATWDDGYTHTRTSGLAQRYGQERTRFLSQHRHPNPPVVTDNRLVLKYKETRNIPSLSSAPNSTAGSHYAGWLSATGYVIFTQKFRPQRTITLCLRHHGRMLYVILSERNLRFPNFTQFYRIKCSSP